VGVFHGVDPLADHPNQVDKSPYAYAWNNQIFYNDPDGRCPTCPQGEDAAKIYATGAVVENNQGSWTWNGKSWDEKPIYGTYMGVWGQLNTKPSAGVAFADSGAKFTADVLTTMVDVATFGAVSSIDDLLILGAKSQLKKQAKEAVKKIEIPDADKIDRNLLDPPGKKGNAPTFKDDGTSVEIHHVDQDPNGPFKEMHKNDHRGKGSDGLNHPNKSKPSQVERREFAKQRKAYWIREFFSF
jgi:hypothetical protein